MVSYSTRALILHFFAYVSRARVATIVRYLDTQWGVAPGATREMLQRLVKERRITRVRRGVYQGMESMDAETQAAIEQLATRLEAVRADAAERIRWLSEHHEREWKNSAAWRTHWTAELDALILEVGVLKLTLEQHMAADRKALLGDDLTQTIDRINAIVRGKVPPAWVADVDELFSLFGDFWAHTLGRATVLAAGAVRAVDDKVEAVADRVTELEKQVGGDGA